MIVISVTRWLVICSIFCHLKLWYDTYLTKHQKIARGILSFHKLVIDAIQTSDRNDKWK